jgi:hypothetical protein
LEGNLCSSTYAWDAITATILAPFHVGRLFSETMVRHSFALQWSFLW